jgi:hypothetical protein
MHCGYRATFLALLVSQGSWILVCLFIIEARIKGLYSLTIQQTLPHGQGLMGGVHITSHWLATGTAHAPLAYGEQTLGYLASIIMPS